jgi:hypothetical protein
MPWPAFRRDSANNAVLQTAAPSTISGTVTDTSGSPVAGVTISDGQGNITTTGSDGSYVLNNVPAGSYTISASATGCTFTPSSITGSVPPNTSGKNFTATCVAETSSISGYVFDEHGDALAGVSIANGAGTSTTTTSAGAYTFEELEAGAYTLTPILDGYTFDPPVVTVSVPPDVVRQNFTAVAIIRAPDIEVVDTELTLELPPDSTDTQTVRISNAGNADLTFDVLDDHTSGWEALVFPSLKIDPLLQQGMQTTPEQQRPFLVYLNEQADLSAAYTLRDRVERGRYVYEALRTTAQDSQADLLRALADAQNAGHVTSYRPYFIVNAILVTGNADALAALESRSDIAHIAAASNFTLPRLAPGNVLSTTSVYSTEWNISHIGADRVWSEFGTQGEGIVVANIDTGVMSDHAALIDQYRGTMTGSHDYNWFDPSGIFPTTPGDDANVGTHTMGTMVGDDGNGNRVGIAPNAQWIAARGCAETTCKSDHLLAAAEWILAPYPVGGSPADGDAAQRPHIVNGSWGSYGGRLWYEAAIQAWRAADIFPAFAAGNTGPGLGSVCSPGDYAGSFVAGAIDSADTIAAFSSQGPSSLTGEIKPDVSAPGVNVRSASNTGGYVSAHGTAIASSHIAGCAALIRSAAADIGADAVEDVLINTAVDLGDSGPDYVYGYGRIDCYAAVAQARASADMLTLSPSTGSLAAGESQSIAVTIDTTGMAPGSYSGHIFISSNDPDEPTIQIPVQLVVKLDAAGNTPTPPAPVTNAQGTILPQGGGAVSSGDLWAFFPSGAVALTTTITYRQTTASLALPDEVTMLRSFTLEASTMAGEVVPTFEQPFELVVRTKEIENPSALTFAFLNQRLGRWEIVPTSVDTTTGRVIGILDRIGTFALVQGEIAPPPPGSGLGAELTVSALITMTVTDEFGAVVAHEPVAFHTDYGTVLPASTRTDGQGRATALVMAEDTPGIATVTMTVGGVSERVMVSFEAITNTPTLYLPLIRR